MIHNVPHTICIVNLFVVCMSRILCPRKGSEAGEASGDQVLGGAVEGNGVI